MNVVMTMVASMPVAFAFVKCKFITFITSTDAHEKNQIFQITLEAPWTLGYVTASRFAVLLLLALAVARRAGQPTVPVYSLHFAGADRNGFSDRRSSRAFKQFAQAGITVGWGRNARADASALSVRGHVHGPFWLARGELERLTFCVNGKRITPAVQKNLLERMSGATRKCR